MKIGLSYSRCVRDIIEGKVNLRDVLVIIARTNFDPRNATQWDSIWLGYTGQSGGLGTYPEWADYAGETEFEDRFRSVTIDLYEQGKLHQPRQFGSYPHRLPYYWLETILVDEDLDKNPTIKNVWEQYQLLVGLVKNSNNRDINDDF